MKVLVLAKRFEYVYCNWELMDYTYEYFRDINFIFAHNAQANQSELSFRASITNKRVEIIKITRRKSPNIEWGHKLWDWLWFSSLPTRRRLRGDDEKTEEIKNGDCRKEIARYVEIVSSLFAPSTANIPHTSPLFIVASAFMLCLFQALLFFQQRWVGGDSNKYVWSIHIHKTFVMYHMLRACEGFHATAEILSALLSSNQGPWKRI